MMDRVFEQRRVSVQSEMVDWRWRFLFSFILESSRNFATALAVSISPIVNIFYWEVALSWFRWEVESHFMEQKLQPRSVFKPYSNFHGCYLLAAHELEKGTLLLAIDPMTLHRNVRIWMYRMCGGFMAELLVAIGTWFTESSLNAQWNQLRYCTWACTGDSLFGTKVLD